MVISDKNDKTSLSDPIDEADLDLKEWEWISKDEGDDVCQRLTNLTRSLSIRGDSRSTKHRKYLKHHTEKVTSCLNENNNCQSNSKTQDLGDINYKNKDGGPEIPLFDCIVIAGLYHDHTINRHVPFTKDVFPEDVSLIIYL